jgi:hypothetical protein
MLEYDKLIFVPSEAIPGWSIRDADSGCEVGVVRNVYVVAGFWNRWRVRARLAVHESEDEPLLCTLRRLWRFREAWELCDADGRVVGKLSRTFLRDRSGRLLTRIQITEDQTHQYLDRHGRVMATLICSGRRMLTFAPECKGDPFTRMLVMGGALIEIVHHSPGRD